MECGKLIAAKLTDVLDSVGYACAPAKETAFVISRLGVRVDVVEGRVNEQRGRVSVFPTIITSHPLLPRGWAPELGVGYGATLEDAVDHVSASWMLLFFPPLKFLFEDQPHDCMVLVREVVVPQASEEGYTLVAGPVQIVGFESQSSNEALGQTRFWECFEDLLIPKLRHGIQHLRCFTGRTLDGGIAGDVYLNGAEWKEGSARVREFARELPEASASEPMVAVKQHLFLRPADPAASARQAEEEKLQIWAESIAPRIDAKHTPLVRSILLGLLVMSRSGSDESREKEMIDRGVTPETAGRLMNFMQSAAARVVLKGQIGFCDTYFWVNSKTDLAVERRYDQTPVFMAALEVCSMLHASGLAGDEISDVASTSAEMNLVRQIVAQGAKLDKARLKEMFHHTPEPVTGEKLMDLLKRREAPPSRKPWWRFW